MLVNPWSSQMLGGLLGGQFMGGGMQPGRSLLGFQQFRPNFGPAFQRTPYAPQRFAPPMIPVTPPPAPAQAEAPRNMSQYQGSWGWGGDPAGTEGQQSADAAADAAAAGDAAADGASGTGGGADSGGEGGAGSGGGYAKGGAVTRVSGPNPPGPDDGSANLKIGEHVINAKQAAKYRGLLEAINAGAPKAKLRGLLG
jgi:hypothetical protein